MSHSNVNLVALYKGNPMEASSSSSTPMVDSFCRTNWDHPMISPNIGFCDVSASHSASTNSNTMGIIRSSDLGWAPSSPMLNGNMCVPSGPSLVSQGLPQFPADSGFIERAARFSCFGRGNFSDLINSYGSLDGIDPYAKGTSTTVMQGVYVRNDLKSVSSEKSPKNDMTERKSNSIGQSCDKAKEGGIVTGNESDEAEFSCGGSVGVVSSSSKALGSKKRKREYQGIKLGENEDDLQPPDGITKNNPEAEPKVEQKVPTLASKSNGKQGKQGSQASDSPKEEYIHVRARRGQATNSHSLAERVRREKISERMKFLQDLVPGCSKVTGKAVMLDEIINYVQSLQKQVEFLSMKLATVDPILDLDLESVLGKDILQPRAGPSSSLGYSPDMSTMTFRQISQPGLIQPSLPGVVTSFDPLRRSISSQLIAMSEGYHHPAQVPNMWVEDELHNVVQMGLNSSAPLDITQDLNGSSSKSHMKVEL